MDSNKRLYVFDRKEILLIFVLIILISTTCFVFGVKIGKSYSLDLKGIVPEDIQRVDLLSKKEEKIIEDEKLLEEIVNKVDDSSSASINLLKQKIDSEVADRKENNDKLEIIPPVETKVKKKSIMNSEVMLNDSASTKKQNISGKWTVQLGSHQNIEDAEAFADGFRVRGYEPIINQVYLSDRGVWFRVSLGLFTSIVEAKNYVIGNQSLFEGQDYVFIQFE
tara:strand:- start:372 stop:1037 length:666 start_codon:yes stop_codon:yes gene_type:complete